MSARPTVDVVVATNRLLPYLAVALQSVRDQTYANRRLILVDDGSEDPAGLERLAGPDAIVLHQASAGLSVGRNAGIAAGDGEFVAFLDDDDIWPPERLDQLVRVLEARPDAVAAFGDGRYVDTDGRPFGTWTTEEAPPEAFLSGATPIPRIVTLVVRREAILRAGGFDPSFRFAEDDEFILRMLRVGPMAGTGTTVVDYRRHDRNVTLADWRERYRASVRAIRTNVADANAMGDERSARLLRRNLRRYRSMMAAAVPGRVAERLRRREFGDAAADLWDGVRISPAGFTRGAFAKVARRS
ncbi:glycosyltransferase family A protein [Agromyces mariniharenae]